ncbi:hypothetical protein QQZ08_005066 [Neonectria magnoliae]|uniref:CASP-like protein n=1 Tax=Neonectria magnoliae TaxID=2732573 RepID=A0ABR1I6F7_9HYPO
MTTPVNASSTGKLWSKSILRLLSTLFSSAIIGVSVFYYKHWTVGAIVMMGPPAGVAILWDFVDAICFCVRRTHDGVPVGACILVDLILFLGFAAMSSVLAFTVSKLSDSGFYFAFFQDGVGAEYLYIAFIFGFLAAYVTQSSTL